MTATGQGHAAAILNELGIDAICERLKAGESITKIAASLGVGKTAVLTWLSADSDRSAQARNSRSDAAMMYDERAEELIEDAKDPFQLAKAREQAQHLRWRASKVNPASYGDKVELTADLTIKTMSEEAINARLARLVGAIAGPAKDAAA